MSTYDIMYQNGDKLLGSDGNYQQSETVQGRVGRSLMAWRDQWPAGRGEIFGCALWEKMPIKHTTANERAMLDDLEESLRDWQDLGMLIINSSDIEYTQEGKPVAHISITDANKRTEFNYPVEVSWEE